MRLLLHSIARGNNTGLTTRRNLGAFPRSLLKFDDGEYVYDLYRDAAGKLITSQGGSIAYMARVKVCSLHHSYSGVCRNDAFHVAPCPKALLEPPFEQLTGRVITELDCSHQISTMS